jgi:transketolase
VRSPKDTLALRVRERIVRMSAGGGCFLGASLSCADLLVALYTGFLRVSRETLRDPSRDVLLLSKGHDVPALYALFAELGFLDPWRLGNHLSPADSIYWHPNRSVPGVEFHSGSLGHLLSVGIGVALDARLAGLPTRVVVVAGDGEMNEGSMWEGLLVASALKLDNLLLVVDRNGFQANARTEDLVPLEPLGEKLRAFGCGVVRCDGHSFPALESALGAFPYGEGGPSALVADTVRGKGLPSIEARADRWFCAFSEGEVEALLEELHGNAEARLVSETQVVR